MKLYGADRGGERKKGKKGGGERLKILRVFFPSKLRILNLYLFTNLDEREE
jgi:hypothetical protein